jgi:hypothetical protein
LHPPSRLHRFEQTFPLSMPISMQDIARVCEDKDSSA